MLFIVMSTMKYLAALFLKNKAALILIFLCFSLYIFGYFIREISNGAGHGDLELHIWGVLSDFEINYFKTLKNYLDYDEATFPFFHTIQHLINPFKNTVFGYTFSNTILNLFILFVFFLFLKKKLNSFDAKNYFYLIPLIFLLSPWFRSSSYWGLTENFALFFFIPSCFYLCNLIENKNNLKSNIYLTIFLSLTIYSRQQYIYFVLSHLIILLFFDRKLINIRNSLVIYLIFSIPGLLTYYYWDVHIDYRNATHSIDYLYSIDNIFYNIPKISSLFFFYSVPILIFNLKKIIKILLTKEFLFIFVLIYLMQIILYKDLAYTTQGGGFIIKFYKIFLNENNYFLILISSLFFSLIFCIRQKIKNEYFIILILNFIVIGLIITLYQEWYDPIYIIIYYLLLPNDIIYKLNMISKKFIIFLFLWEFSILSIAIIYYHFYLNFPFNYNF